MSESTPKVLKNLSTFKGRSIGYFERELDDIPTWAAEHIKVHKQLENAVNAMVKTGEDEKVPKKVLQILKESKGIVGKIANAVEYSGFLKAILLDENVEQSKEGISLHSDPNKLLIQVDSRLKASNSNLREWEINYGLLYSAYQRTNDEEIKTTIRFLMTNYLQKAAYLNSSSFISEFKSEDSYQKMLQLGQMSYGGLYHRTENVRGPTLDMLKLTASIGLPEENAYKFIPVDTIDVEWLYGVSFVTAPDISDPDKVVELLVKQFEMNIDEFPDKNMEFPILIDITAQIGQSLITNQDPKAIEEYKEKQKIAKAQINDIFNMVAEKLKKLYPDRKDVQDEIQDYIMINTAVISRAKVTDKMGVISLNGAMFNENDFVGKVKSGEALLSDRMYFIEVKVKLWAEFTAIGFGAVNFRRNAAEFLTELSKEGLLALGLGQAVSYAVPGKADALLYKEPKSILQTNGFKMLDEIGKKEGKAGEGQVMLAKATAEMMKTLLGSISKEEWDKKQKDPAIRELTQNTIFRISQHLAKAFDKRDNFRQFSQAIDCTHAELTTLLVLYTPFDVSSFETNYKEFIKSNFPPSIKPQQVGLAKSAMNVFSGVNAAVIKNNPYPVRIFGEHSYYEEVELVGGTRNVQQTLDDSNVKKVDLYVAEFYHNIDIDSEYTNYQKGKVVEDIKKIFKVKPETDSLTVAIDATIDETRSDDIKILLKKFRKEINEGKLNIVVFRSGQKFDMLGLDNYYGSPFYIINNGDEKWEEFNKIKTEKSFQTDDLSQQFFSWMAETGPQIVDAYKRQIFTNTRKILEMVPKELTPTKSKDVCVCTFEKGVKTPFIDIKFNLKNHRKNDDLRSWFQNRFIELFVSEDKLVYVRGSFGFPHPNIVWIEPKMRINPGLDPSDIKLFKQIFKELKVKVKEMSQ